MAGKVYGVGVGPGDPELLTLKAVRVLESSDVIGIPAKDRESCVAYRIAARAVPELEKKPVIAVPVPMTTDRARLDACYEEGCRQIAGQLDQGRQVAFLNLGDPCVYGTYMELHGRLGRLGYESVIISGVPSFCAVAAALGVPLGKEKEKIHILPGFQCLEEARQLEGTRILMKTASRTGQVKEQLAGLEEQGKIKAWAVTDCGMESQRVCRDIRSLDETAGYFTTILIKDGEKS